MIYFIDAARIVSVRPSVCLIAATAAGGFAAELPVGRRYRLTDAGALCSKRRRSAANVGRVTYRQTEEAEHRLVQGRI